jgi:hypothetical protein
MGRGGVCNGRIRRESIWMEARNKGQRYSKKGLTFTGPRNLLAWLESPHGAELRGAIEESWLPNLAARLFDNSEESKQLQAEVIERHGRETRCLVVAQPMENGNVFLEAYGPRDLKMHIVTLPVVPLTPECLSVAEKIVELDAPRMFKPLYYPGGRRLAEVIEAMTAEEYLAWEREKEFRREWFKACDRIRDSKALDEVKK